MSTNRLWGLNIRAGILHRHLITFYFASMLLIAMGTLAPQMYGFLFIEFLNIPQSEHGRLAGDLNFWGEIALMASLLAFGPMADRHGRRPVITLGFVLVAIGLVIFPLATGYLTLLLGRIIYAVGLAAISCIVITLIGDYISNESRGKATGLQGVANGLGALFTLFFLLRLPVLLQAQGLSPQDAGTLTYGISAFLSLLVAAWMWFGLRADWPRSDEEDQGLANMVRQGFLAARDPRISLAYGASFVARGNLAIVGTFFTLWGIKHGAANGITTAEALSKAAMMVAVAQGTALLTAPVFGIMADRINRVSAMAIALFISAIGYTATGWIDNPYSQAMMLCAIFIGMGEVACIILSGVLINERAPAHQRGAIVAIFNFTGAVGILVATKAGGYLFDGWRESGPFVLFGIIALLVGIWAIALRLLQKDAQGMDLPSATTP